MKRWGCTVTNICVVYGVPYGRVIERDCTFGRAMFLVEQDHQARRLSARGVHVFPKRPHVMLHPPFEDYPEEEKGFFTASGDKWLPTAKDMSASDWEILTND